jgi:flagellar protein FlbT
MQISLRRGERIYINGAVFRPDRKVCIELLNDVAFLLENHVMQVSDANTPLKQLYFVAQTILMSANEPEAPIKLFREMVLKLKETLHEPPFYDSLELVSAKVSEKRVFDALKIIRGLFPLEEQILHGKQLPPEMKVA